MEKTLYYIGSIGFKLIIIALIYLMFRDPEVEDKPKVDNHDSNNIAFDWEHNRYITKAMADTMIFTGGHWYNKSAIKPRKHKPKPIEHTSSGPIWIRPAGREFIYRRDRSTEQMWRDYQQPHYEPLTEDDIRDIIVTEFER